MFLQSCIACFYMCLSLCGFQSETLASCYLHKCVRAACDMLSYMGGPPSAGISHHALDTRGSKQLAIATLLAGSHLAIIPQCKSKSYVTVALCSGSLLAVTGQLPATSAGSIMQVKAFGEYANWHGLRGVQLDSALNAGLCS